jgi:hypothetical protein
MSKNKMDIAFNITPTAIVFMMESTMFTVNKGDERYNEVRAAIRSEDFEAIPRLLDLKGRLVSESSGGIYLLNGMLRCDEYDIPASLATRIAEMFRQGFSTDRLVMFFENLMQNPNESGTIVDDIHEFLEECNLPITADGHFLAYKMVRPNFMDLYSGSMDNSVGSIVEMDRAKCDTNRGNTCSSGLHFCSEAYLGSYGTRNSDQVVIVKVNPRDVTSIPDDYEGKGRACSYEIVEAIGWDELIKPLFTNEHSEDVPEDEKSYAQDSDTPTKWELRNSNDGSLVQGYKTRKGARGARSGNKSLYILNTETGEVVAGTVSATPVEPEPVPVEPKVVVDDVKPNPSAKLDDKKVREIRKILNGGHYETIVELALMYGVSERSIRRIRDNESWKHVVV